MREPDQQFPKRRWRARLDVECRQSGTRTRMTRYRRLGPLHVQRPLYPECDGTAHIYCVHPPGGIAQGDRLETAFNVRDGGRLLITTPGATKFYRTPAGSATQIVELSVDEGSSIEWMPQPAIVFSGAHARNDTRVCLEEGGRAILWDVACLGCPDIDQPFLHGSWSSAIEVEVDGVPVHVERTLIEGSAFADTLAAPWGLHGRSVLGSLVVYAPGGVPDEVMATLAAEFEDCQTAGVTRMGNLVVCRCLGHRALEVTECLTAVWQLLRPAVLSKPAVLPRVWAA